MCEFSKLQSTKPENLYPVFDVHVQFSNSSLYLQQINLKFNGLITIFASVSSSRTRTRTRGLGYSESETGFIVTDDFERTDVTKQN
jgi:hypothetical protein